MGGKYSDFDQYLYTNKHHNWTTDLIPSTGNQSMAYKGKGKLVQTLFSAPRGAYLLFTCDLARLLKI